MNEGVNFNLLITQGGFDQKDAQGSRYSQEGQLPFNQELDRPAALNVFNNFQGDIVAIASDQTRRDDVSYEDETAMQGKDANGTVIEKWLDSLTALYGIHREETIIKPNEKDRIAERAPSRMRPDGKPFFSSPHDVHLSLLKAFYDNREQIEARHEQSQRGGVPLYGLEQRRDRIEGRHGEYWVVTDLQGARIKKLFGRVLGDPRHQG